MEQNNRINQVVNTAIENIKKVIDTDTIVGKSLQTEGGTIIPITKVSIGFVAGGGEYPAEDKQIKQTDNYPFAGGTGAGVCVQPIGFLVIKGGKVDLVKVDGSTPLNKFIENLPNTVEAITEAIKENKNAKN